jgi:hypothetical protein
MESLDNQKVSIEVENPKKILVAVPTMGIDSDPNRWLKSFLNVINDIRSNGLTHAPLFIHRDHWYPAMNKIFNVAFSHDFDYILRMDDDVWGIGHQHFSKLYEAQKDVIGALYPTRYFPYVYAALNRVDNTKDLVEAYREKENFLTEVKGEGIQKVDLIGFGMTLIKVEPFKLVPRPLFPEIEECPDDTYFAKICQDNKIEQYVHMDVKMAHREVTPMNRVHLMNADARMMLANGILKSDPYNKNPFIDKLVDAFGVDGTKDINKLMSM